MKIKDLSKENQALLIKILKEQNYSLLQLGKNIEFEELSRETIDIICDVVSDYMLSKGFDKNDEPNKIGLQIEELIDSIRG